MDLARAPRRAPLTARKKGSGYENGLETRVSVKSETRKSGICKILVKLGIRSEYSKLSAVYSASQVS